MRLMKLALMSVTLMLTASCENYRATVQSSTETICEGTREAREDHAGALRGLGNGAEERNAKVTGARALGAVASGCEEREPERPGFWPF